MRIPTLHHAQATLHTLQRREAEQAKLHGQIASGLRVQSPSDDPVAAAQGELARSRLARLVQDQRAAQLAQGTLAAADGALAQGVDLLHAAREALVAAGNGGYTADDRAKLALQLRGTREQLLAVANTPDAAGGYVFGGQGATAAPFARTPVGYDAAAGTQQVGEGGRFTSSLDGRAAFLALPQGNGVFVTAARAGNTGSGWVDAGSVSEANRLTGHAYAITVGGSAAAPTYSVVDTTSGAALASNAPWPAGGVFDIDGQRVEVGGAPAPGDGFTLAPAGRQDIFTTLDDAIALLEDAGVPGGAYQERLQRAQVGVDRGLDALLHARSVAAEGLRFVEEAEAAGEQQQIDASGRLSDLRDLDLARGISSLQASQTAYEAALKSYAAIRRTSLFDLIS
jgi:flagellar hook-associated protein 3 FlgL